MSTGYLTKNVRNVDPAIRHKVRARALRQGITMSDVVGQILAEQYGLEYQLSGEKSMGAEEQGSQFLLKLPAPLVDAVYFQARESGFTESSLIQQALAKKLRVRYTPVKRGRRPKAVA